MSTFQIWLGETLLITTIFSLLFWLISPIFSKKPALQHLIWLILLIKFFTPPLFVGNVSVARLLLRTQDHGSPPVALSSSATIAPVALESIVVPPVAKSPADHEPSGLDPAEMVTPALPALNAPAVLPFPSAQESSDNQIDEATPSIWDGYPSTFPDLLAIWIVGAFWMTGYRICQLWQIHTHLRFAEAAPVELNREIDRLCKQSKMAPVPAVVIAGIDAPFIWCFGSLQLIWPKSLSETCSPAFTCVLAHELAHLKRKDHWIAWLILVGDCLWWWNPVFWLVRRNLRQTAELACDHRVIDLLPHGRIPFAKFFLAFAEGKQPAAVYPLLGISQEPARFFERRITMILSNDISARPGLRSWALAAFTMGLLFPSWIFGNGQTDRSAPVLGQANRSAEVDAPEASEAQKPQGATLPSDLRRHPLIEPTYATQSPEYALLAFGPESAHRVWIVRDGETLYVDKNANGDLTDEGEKLSPERAPLPAKISQENTPLTFQVDKLDIAQYPTRDLQLRFYRPEAFVNAYYGPRDRMLRPILQEPPATVCALQCRTRLPQVPSKLEDGMAFLMAGAFDANGFLRFSGKREKAPVIRIGTPLGFDLQLIESDKLVVGQAARLSISVGFKGIGPGTFTSLHYAQTIPESMTPTGEFTLLNETDGQVFKQPFVAKPNQFAWGHYAATILPLPSQGSGSATVHLNFQGWEGMQVEPLTTSFPVTAEIAVPNEFQELEEIKLPFKVLRYAKPKDYLDTLKFSPDGRRIMASA